MVNREQLEQIALGLLKKISLQKGEIEKLQDMLYAKHDYEKSEANPYLLGLKPLTDLSVEHLYWITSKAAIVRDQKIQLNKYFTINEIKRYEKSIHVSEIIEDIYPINIPVTRIGEYHWMAILSIEKILEWYKKQLLRYNPESQRKMKVSKSGSFSINIRKKAVGEIKKQLLEHTYIPDELAFNMNIEDPNLDYEEFEDGLILKSGQFDVIDGWHRITGIIQAKGEDENWTYDNFPVHIMAYDTAQANAYIVQKSKNNPLNKGFVQSIDVQNPVNIIIKKINESPGSLLKGEFGINSTFLDTAYFATVMNKIYPLNKSAVKNLQTASYFVDIFNTIVLSGNHQGKLSKYDILALVYCAKTCNTAEEAIKLQNELVKNIDKWKANNTSQINLMVRKIEALSERGV